MNETLLTIASAAVVFLAVFLVSLTPVAERRGAGFASTTIIGGFLLAVVGLLLGILSGTDGGRIFAAIAAGFLLWGLVVYLIYRTRAANDNLQDPATPGANCASRKTTGSALSIRDRRRTWRTHLFTDFSTAPSDGELKEKISTRGGAYYYIYYSTGHAQVEPSITVICEEGDDNTCLADGSEQGLIDANDPPVRVYAKNVIQPTNNKLRVTAVFGAALNASGGPSVAAPAGPATLTLTFPDASFAPVAAMGTYRWICEKAEESDSRSSPEGNVGVGG